MFYHKFKIDSLPEPVFACSLTAENYRWKNDKSKKRIEIGIIEGGELIQTVNGVPYKLSDISLNTIIGDEDVTMLERTGGKVSITTLAVQFKTLEWELLDRNEVDISDNDCFLFPCSYDIGERKTDIIRLMKAYISHNVRNTVSDRAMCISLWFELAASIDRIFRETYDPKPFYTSKYYIKKVDALLARDYMKPFRVSSIAKEIGVTPNYLSSVYSSGSGHTIIATLNRLRLQHARELAHDGELTNREIAERVGLYDEKYLRSLFKRFWGVSINECRLIDREMTLYHQKPCLKD